MAIVGREAWVRQQERSQAMENACNIPSISMSRLLLVATQMTAVLQQLELSDAALEDDVRMLRDMLAVASSGSEELPSSYSNNYDITMALAVAMMLQAWSAGILETTAEVSINKELGLWNSWTSSSLTRGFAALEKLGGGDWIPLLLPWLPQQHTLSGALLSCCTTPHLVRFLITSLAHHIEHGLLSPYALDAIPAMKSLDDYLLRSSSIASSRGSAVAEARSAFVTLEEVLDTWLARHMKQTLPSQKGSSNAEEEVFQAACQLRTRVALFFSTLRSCSSTEAETSAGVSVDSLRASVDNIGKEDIKEIWQRILYVKDPLSENKKSTMKNGKSSSCPPPSTITRFAVGLAAHAAVSALFLHPHSTTRMIDALSLQGNMMYTSASSIFSDPDPASPGRVVLAALGMLEEAANGATTRLSDNSHRANSTLDQSKKKTKKGNLVFYSECLEILPSLIWAVSGLVEDLRQKQELLQLFLGNNTSIFPRARELLEAGESREGTATGTVQVKSLIKPFHLWALKESIALSNLVRIDEDSSKIKVAGEEAPRLEAAVHAVFPAALLCPGVLLKVLLEGAAGQRGKAMLFAGILQQLPTLKSVTNTINKDCQPVLLDLLKNQLRASSATSLDEDQRSPLQHCLVTLCSPSSARDPSSSSFTAYGNTNIPTAVSAVLPEVMLEYAVLPALHGASTAPIEGAQDLALLFKISWLLLKISSTGSSSRSTTTASLRTVCSRLLSVSFKFLDFSSRRIDLNPLGLQLPREVIEEAYAVAQICGKYAFSPPSSSLVKLSRLSQPSTSSGASNNKAGGTIWECNDAVCDILSVYIASYSTKPFESSVTEVLEGIEPSQIKDALVVTCAVMLPCCAIEEASKLFSWFKEAVGYCLVNAGDSAVKRILENHPKLEREKNFNLSDTILEGAVIEVLCRAVHAVAFVPGLIPIAGEEIPIKDPPSQLRCRAVARLLQHLSLASQTAIERAAPASLHGALIARIFKEISRCAASLDRYYDVSTLHVCLMQLIHVLKQEVAKSKLTLSTEVKDSIETTAKLLHDPALSASIASLLEY
jgi:hypothetical protein